MTTHKKATNNKKKPAPKLRKYSVLLLYPDYIAENFGEDTFYGWTRATDSFQAIAKVQLQAAIANEVYFEDYFGGEDLAAYKPHDFGPLLVVEGHHKGLNTEKPL